MDDGIRRWRLSAATGPYIAACRTAMQLWEAHYSPTGPDEKSWCTRKHGSKLHLYTCASRYKAKGPRDVVVDAAAGRP